MASVLSVLLLQERSDDIRRLLLEGLHEKITLEDYVMAAECYAHLDAEDRAACMIEWESFSRTHNDVVDRVQEISDRPKERIEAELERSTDVDLAKRTVQNLFDIAARGLIAAGIIEED